MEISAATAAPPSRRVYTPAHASTLGPRMRPLPRPSRAVAAALALLCALLAPTRAPAQIVAESLGDRIVRFWPDAASRARALPSLTLDPRVHSESAAPASFRVRPEFPETPGGTEARIATPHGTSLYGTGMVPGALLRNGTSVTLWNTDAYGWDGGSPSLYQSHPWVLAVRRD